MSLDNTVPCTRHHCCVLLFVATLSACGTETGARASSTSRDSAGVRIVENVSPRFAQKGAWSIATEPLVEIGAEDGDSTALLFRVFGATRAGGHIVIANAAPPMLRWYDETGAFLHGSGRAGGGPGEFGDGWMSAIWPIGGDSVATWEHPARRMQVFDATGRFVRAVTLELPPDMPPRSYPQMLGRAGDAGFIAFLAMDQPPGPIGQVDRDSLLFLFYDTGGRFGAQIAHLPGFMTFNTEYEADGRTFPIRGRPPFSKPPAMAVAADRFYYGSGDAWDIEVRDLDGTMTMRIRRPEPSTPLTGDIIDAYKRVTMERAPADPVQRERWERSIDRAPYPDSVPPYRRIRVDLGGALWVLNYDMPGDSAHTWSVFDREGTWLSDVDLPANLEIQEIGNDHILALVTDELGVERVRMYALSRGTAAGPDTGR
jgi:hypothetical protein